MEVGRLYLDANILIALGEGRGEIRELLIELAAQYKQGRTPFLRTSELTLAEILVGPYRENNEELIATYDGWLISGSFMDVGPVDRSVLWYAAVLRAAYQSIKLPDAIHISTAIGFGCTHMLTADIRLPKLIELTHHRWGVSKGPATLEMLYPEPETLRRIIEGQRAS